VVERASEFAGSLMQAKSAGLSFDRFGEEGAHGIPRAALGIREVRTKYPRKLDGAVADSLRLHPSSASGKLWPI
jgi:hypothetical protein